MPVDAPDYWAPTTPAMPIIGEGQVAWFQSEAALVAADDTEDLINYVVPDDMELHVCSGIISCAFPCIQRYKLITTPGATYISPTSFIDSDNEWTWEERAYDGNLSTFAYSRVAGTSWSSYLIFPINEQYINKGKFYALCRVEDVDEIDMDFYYGDDWEDIYEGVFASETWVEKSNPAGSKLVSKARVRFYNSADSERASCLFEFMFNTSGETAQEGIYFDTHAIIPYLPQAPYLVPTGATFLIRVYNDEEAAHNMSVSLAGYLQSKV